MIFLIGHKKRHGKDTVAKMIQEYIGGEIVSFATPFKRIMADTLGITTEKLEKLKNDNPSTYRVLLQRFGSGEMKRYFGDNVWAKLLYDNLDSRCPHHIISDFRFKAEMHPRATTINVVRPGMLDDDTHPSETELDDFDYHYTIVNDGTLEDLRTKVYEVVQDALEA